MRGIEFIRAEHSSRACDVQRHAMGDQPAHLIRRRLRAQHHVGADKTGGILGLVALHIEGVLHLARRMVRTEVQRIEVEPFGLHLRAVRNLPSHAHEEVLDVLHELGQRMAGTKRLAANRQRHVDGFSGQLGSLLGRLHAGLLRAIGTAEIGTQLAHDLAGFLLLVLRQRADRLAGPRHRGICTRVLRFDGFQFLHRGGLLYRGDAFGDVFGHRIGVEYYAFCHKNPFLHRAHICKTLLRQ